MMATAAEIKTVMGTLAKAYPRYSLDAETIRVYAAGLKGITAEALGAAASQIIMESKWFPTVAEIREAARVYRPQEDLTDADSRRMAERLRRSWQCCPACWQRPCALDCTHKRLPVSEPVALGSDG